MNLRLVGKIKFLRPGRKPKPIPETKSDPKTEIVMQDVMPAVQASLTAIDGYAAKADQLNQSNSSLMSGVKDILSKLSSDKGEWTVTVNRDTFGILQSLKVTKQ